MATIPTTITEVVIATLSWVTTDNVANYQEQIDTLSGRYLYQYRECFGLTDTDITNDVYSPEVANIAGLMVSLEMVNIKASENTNTETGEPALYDKIIENPDAGKIEQGLVTRTSVTAINTNRDEQYMAIARQLCEAINVSSFDCLSLSICSQFNFFDGQDIVVGTGGPRLTIPRNFGGNGTKYDF